MPKETMQEASTLKATIKPIMPKETMQEASTQRAATQVTMPKKTTRENMPKETTQEASMQKATTKATMPREIMQEASTLRVTMPREIMQEASTLRVTMSKEIMQEASTLRVTTMAITPRAMFRASIRKTIILRPPMTETKWKNHTAWSPLVTLMQAKVRQALIHVRTKTRPSLPKTIRPQLPLTKSLKLKLITTLMSRQKHRHRRIEMRMTRRLRLPRLRSSIVWNLLSVRTGSCRQCQCPL